MSGISAKGTGISSLRAAVSAIGHPEGVVCKKVHEQATLAPVP